MKLLIILSVIACSYAAKLDRTYLPPSSAASAGGSPGSLTTPLGSGQPGLPSFAQSSGSGFGQPAFEKSVPNFGQQPSGPSGLSQPSGPSFDNGPSGYKAPTATYGQPSGSSFGNEPSGYKAPTATYGQPSGPSFGNGPSGYKAPTATYGQPSGPSFGNGPSGYKAPSATYGQPSAGLGQLNSAGSAISQGPSFAGPAEGFDQTSFGQSQETNGYSAQKYQPERARASIERNAEILRYDNQNDGNTFVYSFETSNGIAAEESGVATNGVQAQGSFSYTDDDGQFIRVTYTADENGYQPQGDHLPTPPPIPDEILRSIEENARAAAAGTQEGAYNPDEDDSGFAPQQYSSGAAPSYQSQGSTTSQTEAYNKPQDTVQGPQQYGAPSTISLPSQARPTVGTPSFQGFGSLNQYKPAFAQNGQIARVQPDQSGYQYTNPQSTSSFGRQTVPAGQVSAGQFTPESSANQYNGAQQSFSTQRTSPAVQGQGLFGTRPAAQAPGNAIADQTQGPSSFPTGSGIGFAPAPVPSNQGPVGPSAPRNGQYQPAQPSTIRSSMPQSAPYQYQRPSQQEGAGAQQPNAQQSGFKSSPFSQGSPAQTFGAPRQPPSFNNEDGYKY